MFMKDIKLNWNNRTHKSVSASENQIRDEALPEEEHDFRKYPNVVRGGVQSVMNGKVIETPAKRIYKMGYRIGLYEERIYTEREQYMLDKRLSTADQRLRAAEHENSILQEELEKVKQQLHEALLLQESLKMQQQ